MTGKLTRQDAESKREANKTDKAKKLVGYK